MKNRSAKSGSGSETPLMLQYARIKAQYPDAILLFRIGDFYETFGEDAVITARTLGIVLTKRNNGAAGNMDLAGFPHHAIESYLPRLVRAGHRVAICDQLEDPKLAKTVVKRGVTEVVTPGVAFSDRVVDQQRNNWLASICGEGERFGLAFLDVTTGEFMLGEDGPKQIARYLDGHAPSELLHPRGAADPFLLECTGRHNAYALEDWAFTEDLARERLLRQFGTSTLKGFGIDGCPLGQRAAGAILQYLGDTRHEQLSHISRIARLRSDRHLSLDRFTIRNLELVAPVNEGARTLLQAMDRCATPMGSRQLRRWLLFPLLDGQAIAERQDRVQLLMTEPSRSEAIGNELSTVGDLERLLGRAAAGRCQPREMLQMRRALEASARIGPLLGPGDEGQAGWAASFAPPVGLAERIAATIEPDAPATLNKDGVIRGGVHPELDELRHIVTHAKELLLGIQQREAERTGIGSLKVGFNNVFGYYLEVRNTHKARVPPDWVRKQTLTGAERYVTEELKTLEERILGAEERMLVLGMEIFEALVREVVAHMGALQQLSSDLSELDVLRSFALNAAQWGYCRPRLDADAVLDIRQGRHPVIEQQMKPGEAYVPNDLLLDPADLPAGKAGAQMLMITGPNMSGKSALLRQTALTVLMAQCGSFVPAASARIGIVDRIFTRVGASDNLSTGESTFMVEMNETASILNNLSPRSLVLLDEIGRGTSTYDGVSIAWAIAEYLHGHEARPKTLFATHYHELNEMAATFPRIRNANVAVREVDGRVLFLRKLVPGGSDRSFGIHVAQMAGMPRRVIERAQHVLHHLERSHAGDLGGDDGDPMPPARPMSTAELGRELQLSIFQLDDPALERIREEIAAIDIDTLTPVEALLKLNEIKRLVAAKKPKREALKR